MLTDDFLKIIERARVCIDLVVILEALCYKLGVVCLALCLRGLAALRVFRISGSFHISNFWNAEILAANRPFRLVKAAKLCSFYMEQLFGEFCTQQSLGSLLIFSMFFFSQRMLWVQF